MPIRHTCVLVTAAGMVVGLLGCRSKSASGVAAPVVIAAEPAVTPIANPQPLTLQTAPLSSSSVSGVVQSASAPVSGSVAGGMTVPTKTGSHITGGGGSASAEGKSSGSPGTTQDATSNSKSTSADATNKETEKRTSENAHTNRPSAAGANAKEIGTASEVEASVDSGQDATGERESAAGKAGKAKPRRDVWGGKAAGGSVGLVYPVAPPQAGVTAEMIDSLRLPDNDPRKPVVGVWEQSAGANGPDFAHGGYTQTVLVIRSDGTINISRYYGPASEVRLETTLAYTIPSAGRVELRQVDGSKAPAESKELRLPLSGKEYIASPPTVKMPVTFEYRAEEGTLSLGGKTYRRREK